MKSSHMKSLLPLALPVSFLAAMFGASIAMAQAPAGSTGECKDGTYSSAATKRGACNGHKGVKEWYDAQKGGAAPATTPEKSPASTPVAKAAPTPMPTTAAAGGGAGKVWVNSASNVYHCNGTKWYGKTKKGEYMTETEAKAKGAHADHGKACA